MPRQLRHKDYTVGWICALPVELAAAQEMLDEEHANLEHNSNDNDENLYALGSIGGHNVVIVCLPAGRIGNNPAATVAMQMRATFKGIRFGLMVGIGGGVPSTEVDIRLGDVVVSHPDKSFGGVVQYDFGKATLDGFERTGLLNSPPQMLLSAVARVQANELRGRSKVPEHIAKLDCIPKFQRSRTGSDVLFQATYNHEGGQTCNTCSTDKQEARQPRDSEEEIVVHYGIIASGNQVIKNAEERDKVSAELGGILCFEMEAAGLMNSFPCLVIRGICDYADSHKNKKWQPYAAGTAAAYAKEVLSVIPPTEVAKTCTVEEAMQTASTELDVLKQQLMVDQTCQKISIVGLGGTGKTQVALQFAYLVKETWPDFSIFWMPALSIESFEQACVHVAKALHITTDRDKDVKELVQQWLNTGQAGRWLLVLDNADDSDILFGTEGAKGIFDYLPESDKGLTVYTTRTQEIAVFLTRANIIELGPMNRPDAVEYLNKSLIRKDHIRADTAMTKLIDALDCLPLAITQATAYLNMNKMSVAKYLRLLQNSQQYIVSLMSWNFHDNTRYKGSENAVATTWIVSFQQICERDAVAADLLAFMSCIEWKAIPRSLLPSVQLEARMEEAIGTLCGYSFLARREDTNNKEEEEEEDWYDMHRLVHLATRIWTGKQGDAGSVTERAIQHIAQVFPSNDWKNRALWRSYLPHALRLLEDMQDCDAAGRSKLSLLVGRCLQADGRNREAVRWLEMSCQQRQTLEEGDSDQLASQYTLAGAYQANGQVKEAVKLLEKVVAIKAEVLAEDHPSRLASQDALAQAYQANGKVKEAVKLLEKVVAIHTEVLEEDHPSRLASQHTLAGAYRANGQAKEAVKLLEKVVAIHTEVLEEGHPNRLESQYALARAYQANGQVKEAVKLLEKVVAIQAGVLAEDHPFRIVSQHVLSRAYQALQTGWDIETSN